MVKITAIQLLLPLDGVATTRRESTKQDARLTKDPGEAAIDRRIGPPGSKARRNYDKLRGVG